MLLIDAGDGRIIDANDAALRFYGYSKQQITAMNIGSINKLLPEILDADQQKAITGEQSLFTRSHQLANGEIRFVEVHTTPISIKDADYLFSIVHDSTERKQAEESLRKSEAKFRAVVENSNDGIIFADASAIIHFRSPSYNKINGFTDEERLGKSGFDTVHPDDVDMIRSDWAKLVQHPESSIKTEYRIRHKDGSWRWIGTNGRNLLHHPDVASIVISSRDITERKRTEDALRKSESRYKMLFDAIPESVLLIGPDNRVVAANRASARLYGYESPQQLVGFDTRMLIAGKDRERAAQIQTKVLQGEEGPVRQYTEVRRDGSEFIAEVLSTTIHGSQKEVIGYIGITRDITEINRAEIELKKSAALIRTAIENLPIIFYMIDCEGTFRLSIGAGLKGLGLEQNQVVGQSVFDVYKDFPEIINSIRRALSGETVNFESHVAGSSFLNIGVPFSEMSEGPGGIVAVALDITERKNAEDALRNMQKLESLGILAGGIAHDFNNLMCGIFGYIDMAIEETKEGKVTQYLSKAMNQIDRAKGLTQQLLTFAKGGAPIRKTGPLFPFVKETAQFALSGSSVSCRFEISDDLRTCEFDTNQIGQVIDNIVINAQQAMPCGGTIDVFAKNVLPGDKIPATLVAGNYVVISIKDSGIGIPKEILSRIFDPFFTTKATGHGLGLATCYSIINRHGGCIDVESEPGKGSTFHIYLPAATGSDISSAKKSTAKHKGSGTFLLMDDQEAMRDTVGDMLDSLGYMVVCKENGKDAIDFVTSEYKANRKIAGMLFDLTIPGGMGGKEAVVEIRKLDACAKTPVFVASGYAEDPVMANPVEYGFTASIGKPFKKTELVKLLNEHLKQEKQK
jgi:PAS domain S-box-containing protein